MKATADVPEVFPELGGDLGVPRKNGEPVFNAPWQSRAFGMVVRLNTQGVYVWEEFKQRLIAQIAAGNHTDPLAESVPYYDAWVEAFWRLLIEKGICSEQEMLARTSEFQSGIRQEVY